MIFLTLDDVIKMHDSLVDQYGGSHGIRDIGLLISAVEMPRSSMFGEDLHKTPYDKASAYLFHIVRNHAFIDGNKRTGSLAALTFLDINNVNYYFHAKKYEDLVLNVANGIQGKKEISEFFSKGFEK